MFHCCWKPRIAKTIRSSESGISSSVRNPSSVSGSAGASKPVLSRSNQAGAATAAKMIRIDRQRGRDRQHAAVPARDVVREQQVDEDVEDVDRLGALELVPAADRDHGDEPGRPAAKQRTIAFVCLVSGISRFGCRTVSSSLGHSARKSRMFRAFSATRLSGSRCRPRAWRNGRRASLRSWWAFARGGSSPSARMRRPRARACARSAERRTRVGVQDVREQLDAVDQPRAGPREVGGRVDGDDALGAERRERVAKPRASSAERAAS